MKYAYWTLLYVLLLVIAKRNNAGLAYWELLFIPLFIIGVVFRILSPIAVIFVKREAYTTTVKRLGRQVFTLQRDRLVWWLTWFDTDDNATDEYWYGMYPLTKYFTQEQYDNSKVLRWFFRACWLQRNSAYTFNRKFFGLAKDSPLAWQYKAQKPLWFGYYNDINIGFKTHRNIDRLMYAGRVLGLRKYKN